MKIFTLKRWSDFTRGQKLGLTAGVLAACLILGTALGLILNYRPSALPKQESLPVIAQSGGESIESGEQGIEFSAEIVRPLPQGRDYFVNYRLQREASRQEAKDMLAPLLNSNVDKSREEAQEKWLQLTHKIEKEEQIENLLKISGIQDAIADVGKSEIAVIIYAPHLNPEEIKLIQDVVFRVTNMPKEQVRIAYRY